jgi:hypothetical protein
MVKKLAHPAGRKKCFILRDVLGKKVGKKMLIRVMQNTILQHNALMPYFLTCFLPLRKTNVYKGKSA